MLEEEPSVLLSVTDFGKILSSNPKKKLQNKRKRSRGFEEVNFLMRGNLEKIIVQHNFINNRRLYSTDNNSISFKGFYDLQDAMVDFPKARAS